MIDIINEKPCVVETPQGFSVSYKNRFLYSKYAPSRLIVQKVNNLDIMEGSVFICKSPALCYGIPELIKKLPENCLIYLCEFDQELHSLTESSPIYKSIKENSNVKFPSVQDLYNLPVSIFNEASLEYAGKLKRIISIDFSSGTQFAPELYKKLENACITSIKTFWTNRLTLTKFGRKYSHNYFTNLKNIAGTTPIESYFSSVKKPIIIFGAGQGVDSFFNNYNISRDDYFILCVDTILSALISRNIVPDGVFVEEAQSIISKAFICPKFNVQLFTGLSSLSSLSMYFPQQQISYFTTEFTKAEFINKMEKENLIPPVNPPFGSVGLTAVYYGLRFRHDSSLPVYVTGLDFSYSTGYTHGKGALAHTTQLINTNKLNPVENYGAAFSASSIKVTDKAGNLFITTPSLNGYCNLFNNMFFGTANLFDVSDCGLSLAIPRIKLPAPQHIKPDCVNSINKKKATFPEDFSYKLSSYLDNEIKELKYLRKLLTEESSYSPLELQEEITKIATSKEYLYLHFPDGYCFQYNQSFLNRIRTEIDFFLKIFD